jgi:hypothetical protein
MTFGRLLLSAVVAVAAGAASAQQPPAPYTDPPFASRCMVQHFDEGQIPDINGFPQDPLCVEFQKRDITASNGGAIRFLAAEPSRFLIAIPKCQYWQQDHWRVQVTPDTTTIVGWDGSYWFDKGNGTGGARLRNFKINDVPVGADQAAAAMAPFDADFATIISRYGEGSSGGGSAVFCLGAGDPQCPAPPPGTCGSESNDLCQVTTARATADEQCDCSIAPCHRHYVECVGRAADGEVTAGRLPARCKGDVVRCASHSTCGREGSWVTCCRTDRRGVSRCNIKRDAAHCKAPRGGQACAGVKPSCCEACGSTGCNGG